MTAPRDARADWAAIARPVAEALLGDRRLTDTPIIARRRAQTPTADAGGHNCRTRGPRPPRPSRRGRKAVTIYLETEVHRQLRMLGLETNRSGQDLLVEAVNELFQKHGKARIAD